MASTAISAFGQIQGGNSKGAMADYNAQVANQNAAQVTQQANKNAQISLVNSSKVIGQGQASYGAAGVTSTGSAMDVLQQSARNAQLDALNIQYGGAVKAQSYDNEAALDQYRGNNDRLSGYLSATGSLLNSGGGGGGGGGGAPGGSGVDAEGGSEASMGEVSEAAEAAG